jgi:Txe/YoeB family toxin of Txe-Axe toxin-antitoxin module
VRLSVFDPQFREDLTYWVEQSRKVALRILHLVEAVMRHSKRFQLQLRQFNPGERLQRELPQVSGPRQDLW